MEWPWWCTERMSHVQQQQPMSALLVFCTHVMDYSDVHADHVDLTSPDLTCFSRELTGSDRCAQPLPFVNPCVRCVQCAQASGVKGTSMVVCIYYIVCLCVCFSLSLCVCVCVCSQNFPMRVLCRSLIELLAINGNVFHCILISRKTQHSTRSELRARYKST